MCVWEGGREMSLFLFQIVMHLHGERGKKKKMKTKQKTFNGLYHRYYLITSTQQKPVKHCLCMSEWCTCMYVLVVALVSTCEYSRVSGVKARVYSLVLKSATAIFRVILLFF